MWIEAKTLIIVSILATLAYASYRDIKYRDIPEVTWVPAIAISITVNVLSGRYDLLHTALSMFPVLIVFVMSLLGMIGGADFLALLMIALAHPRFLVFPISLLTLLYSLLIPLGLMIYYALCNALLYKSFFNKIRCKEGRKTYLIFFGRPMSVKEMLEKKFTYPLTIPVGKGEFICRPSFSDDDEEEERIKERIKGAIARGEIQSDEKIWVTPGLPHVVFFFIGYILALLTPQHYILTILMH